MTPPTMCPCCGYNFEADTPIERDGFFIDPRGVVSFAGKFIAMSPGERSIFHALAKGDGAMISSDALLNRISFLHSVNIVAVMVCRIRRQLREAGVPSPIFSRRGDAGGYRWQVAELAEAA